MHNEFGSEPNYHEDWEQQERERERAESEALIAELEEGLLNPSESEQPEDPVDPEHLDDFIRSISMVNILYKHEDDIAQDLEEDHRIWAHWSNIDFEDRIYINKHVYCSSYFDGV